MPLAAAVKLTRLPMLTVWLVGCVVTAGAVSTINVDGPLRADPRLFVKVAS